MALDKARVQLLDPNTGAVLKEVEIITDSSVVKYVNENPISRDVGGIKKGTTFSEADNQSVKDVLDKLLYPGNPASAPVITDDNSNEYNEDTIVYVEKFKEVRPFFVNCTIDVGDRSELTITLKRFDLVQNTVNNTERTVSVTPGTQYIYQQRVEKISNDTKLQLVISDGATISSSPIIEYRFIYPVFVGYCDINEVVGPSGVDIDIAKGTNYFNIQLKNGTPLLEKRVVPISDIESFAVDNPVYDETLMNPCILYPNQWNKVDNIVDGNGGNIMASFINGPLPIKPDTTVSSNVQYSAYICKNKYPVNSSATKAITYRFSGKGSVDSIGEGVPSLTGFDLLAKLPLDSRLTVKEYDDLALMLYPYDGLITYVVDEHTYFKYDAAAEEWTPTNQQTHFQTTGTEPSIDVGGWNDIVMDLYSGYIYQKNQNLSWEIKGQITKSSGVVPAWIPARYKSGYLVVHKNKYWTATADTEAEPGSNYEWENTVLD